jgi:CMP-N,N'-diacetyllegionaminic acid synthase
MFLNKKIIALVPARGGSKSIKLKNLKKIKNISLIGHVAKFIQKSKIFDLSLVSTDNNKIAKEALKFNLKVLKRPNEISGDFVSDYKVLHHCLSNKEISSEKYDYIVYLQPTSPIRKVSHLLNALKKVINLRLNGSWSLTKIEKKFHPLKIIQIKNKYIHPYNKNAKKIIARQTLSDVFIRNGVFYIFSINKLIKYKTIYLNRMFPSITDYKSINVDYISDLKEAKKIIKC